MLLQLVHLDMPIGDILFFDSGWDFPVLSSHLDQLSAFIQRPIHHIYPEEKFLSAMLDRPIRARSGPLAGQVHRYGHGWPSWSRRWCTRAKSQALARAARGRPQYIGIAADELSRLPAPGSPPDPLRLYPLADWGWSQDQCLSFCKSLGFDWNGHYDRFPRLSCFCCPLQRIASLRTLRSCYPSLWSRMLRWDAALQPPRPFWQNKFTVHDLDARFRREDQASSFRFFPSHPSSPAAHRRGAGDVLSEMPAAPADLPAVAGQAPRAVGHCEDCNGTGWYGDNGPGIVDNSEFVRCDCGTAEKCGIGCHPYVVIDGVAWCRICNRAADLDICRINHVLPNDGEHRE